MGLMTVDLVAHNSTRNTIFHATLEGLAGSVAATEAGMMLSRMTAPCVPVAEAARTIGEWSILLPVGQELPADPGDAFRIVRANLELAGRNPRVLLGYTGMEWRLQAPPDDPRPPSPPGCLLAWRRMKERLPPPAIDRLILAG
jgi:hypothetical protein